MRIPGFLNRIKPGAIALLMLVYSCTDLNKGSEDISIARVNSKYLYLSDVAGIVPPGTSSADSMEISKRFIENWIKQQVFLDHAEKNLSVDLKTFDKKIEDYRNSLVLFAYESEYVRANLDTLVTEQQLQAYYEKNQGDFRLKDNIVKVSYVKVVPDAPQQELIRKLIKSTEAADVQALEEYGSQHAVNYFIGGEYWILFNDLLREVPIQSNNHDQFIRSTKYYEMKDENFKYFLVIHDFRTKENISPISFEKENIKSIILNQRRHEMISKLHNDLYKEAVSKGSFEIYK